MEACLIPDPYSKQIKIPIKITNGKVQFFNGRELPKLKDGTIGDLLIHSLAVEDPVWISEFMRERIVVALPEGTCLLVQIRVPKSASFHGGFGGIDG